MKQMAPRSRLAIETMNVENVHRLPTDSGLTECRGELVPGKTCVWYEYKPESYDGKTAVPLIVQLHGGGQDGHRWFRQTLWHRLADKLGMIVVFPSSPVYGAWRCGDEDVQYLYDLIRLMREKYTIDGERIFMQGMSNGDMMTLSFTMKHAGLLAGAGYFTGPSSEEMLDGERPTEALPILQMRGELDVNWRLTSETEDIYAVRYGMNDFDRAIWEPINETSGVCPVVEIAGKDNFLYYDGGKAPILQWEIQAMGHREPSYGAQVLWDRLYSGCARKDGKPIWTAPNKPVRADGTVLIALGSNKALVGDHIVSINELDHGVVRLLVPADLPRFCPVKLDEMGETEALCAPVEIFESVFGAKVAAFDSGATARVTLPDGREFLLRDQTEILEVDGEYRAMQKPCFLRGGVLYAPIGELCEMLMNKFVTVADDVMCIADHYAILGRYTARTVCALLGGQARPHTRKP